MTHEALPARPARMPRCVPTPPPAPATPASGPPGLPQTPERREMLALLEAQLGRPVAGYAWGFRLIHPVALLVISFAISQVLNELLMYELFEAYGTRSLARTVAEVLSPLTLWFFVDTLIQVLLTLVGRGHRVLVQTWEGELLVLHRRLLSSRPDALEHRVPGSLAIAPGSLGYAVDRLDTAVGRFYIWARWRDMRLLLGQGLSARPAAGPERPADGG